MYNIEIKNDLLWYSPWYFPPWSSQDALGFPVFPQYPYGKSASFLSRLTAYRPICPAPNPRTDGRVLCQDAVRIPTG